MLLSELTTDEGVGSAWSASAHVWTTQEYNT
jgi:hypothetical protein